MRRDPPGRRACPARRPGDGEPPADGGGNREEFGSFDAYLWGFTNGRAIVYDRPEGARLPSSNGLSAAIATGLRARGFSFVGPTTVYAFLQGVGVVCDHDGDCPIGREILAGHPHELRPADGEVL